MAELNSCDREYGLQSKKKKKKKSDFLGKGLLALLYKGSFGISASFNVEHLWVYTSVNQLSKFQSHSWPFSS